MENSNNNETLDSMIEEMPAEPVRFNLILNDGSVINCRSGRDAYESLFGARLEYMPRTIHNLNRGDYMVWEWQEIEPAGLPDGMEKYFSCVELEKKIYLTD